MKWPILVGKARAQPAVGGYADWKAQVAADCENRCVYCSLHESEHGGVGNFHIDHFRPQSLFGALRDIIANLYLSCPVCNRFKSNDWPVEPAADCSLPAYADPVAANYNSLLSVDDKSFRVSSNRPAGNYTIERLYLNRPQMIRHWRARFLAKRVGEIEDEAMQMLATAQESNSLELTKAVMKCKRPTEDLIGGGNKPR